MRLFSGRLPRLHWLTLLLLLLPHVLSAEEAPIATQIEDLKKQVIELNRDLFILEEDLLFPASTQIAVFLSVDTGQFLRLDSVKLKVGEEIVAAHLYTDRQIRALERGGMQRLYVGNLKSGEHDITAFVEGVGPENREYKQAATRRVNKGTDVMALEVRVSDASSNYQPQVQILEWE